MRQPRPDRPLEAPARRPLHPLALSRRPARACRNPLRIGDLGAPLRRRRLLGLRRSLPDCWQWSPTKRSSARARTARTRRRSSDAGFGAGFQDLKEGDLVVHADFGVARYAGLTSMTMLGVKAELLVLQFAGKDKVYLPVSRLRLISRFTSTETPPRSLSIVSASGTWEKTKKRIKEHLLKMAAELLRLYAAAQGAPRALASRHPDRYFRAIRSGLRIRGDARPAARDRRGHRRHAEDRFDGPSGLRRRGLRQDRSRDARTAFKSVLDRKQVAVLVPTTRARAPALQHVSENASTDYPVTIEVVGSHAQVE